MKRQYETRRSARSSGLTRSAAHESIAPTEQTNHNEETLMIHPPRGPFALAEQIGLEQVSAVMNALYEETREERNRVAPLLKQMALTGAWWKHNNTET